MAGRLHWIEVDDACDVGIAATGIVDWTKLECKDENALPFRLCAEDKRVTD
jgi:hypothetical protein